MSLHNEIFKIQVWKYFCNDIDSCIEVSKEIKNGNNSRFKGGLNYTSALAIFSVIDMMSGYFSGTKNVNSNISASFLVKYLSKYEENFKEKIFAKKFYEIFRHGLSHDWQPKYSGVSMYSSKMIVYIDEKEDVPVLAIPTFYENIKKALKDYENDLNNDKKLQDLFIKRYNVVNKQNKEEIDVFKKYLLMIKK